MDESGRLFTPYVQNLAIHTMVNGAPSLLSSPCGVNCSFALTLDVPYLECHSTVSNVSFHGDGVSFDFPMFNATWSRFVFNVTTYYTFLATTLPPTGNNTYQWAASTQANNTVCTPARTNYTLNIMYENNVQKLGISRGVVIPLNLTSPAPAPSTSSEAPPSVAAGPAVVFPGFMGYVPEPDGSVLSWYGIEALEWTAPFASWYRDLQLMALIAGMADSLAGNVIFTQPGIGTQSPYPHDLSQG
jgi:hypothetical protein